MLEARFPPPDRPVPAVTVLVLGTAPVTLATGMAVEAVTRLEPLAYIYPVKLVTDISTKDSVVPPLTFSQVEPLKIAKSPTDHNAIPFRLVVPATETM